MLTGPVRLPVDSAISFARRNSLFSRSSSRIRARSSLVTPGRWPRSTSARRTQFRNVSRFTSTFSAIDTIAFHCDGYSCSWSKTIRTARSRISAGYLPPFPTVMTPSSQELEPPPFPGRFNRVHRGAPFPSVSRPYPSVTLAPTTRDCKPARPARLALRDTPRAIGTDR